MHIKETSPKDALRHFFYAFKTYIIIDNHERTLSLNPMCPKFILNKQVFEESKFKCLRFHCISLKMCT